MGYRPCLGGWLLLPSRTRGTSRVSGLLCSFLPFSTEEPQGPDEDAVELLDSGTDLVKQAKSIIFKIFLCVQYIGNPEK